MAALVSRRSDRHKGASRVFVHLSVVVELPVVLFVGGRVFGGENGGAGR
jgi:hypothetical protein